MRSRSKRRVQLGSTMKDAFGLKVCASSHNLLRCARCQNCYCQSHQLSHWQTHQDALDTQLLTSGQAEAKIPSEWGEDETGHIDVVAGLSATSSTSSSNYPENLLEEQFRADQQHHDVRQADQGTFVHGWPTETDISGYENDWAASGGTAVDNVQFAPQPYLHPRDGVRLAPRASEMPPSGQNQSLWMRTMCQYVIHDLEKYGICVIDNFAGQAMGDAVLEEVVAMYAEGQFMDGEVMSTSGGNATKTIRGDKIVWVDGNEPICKNIGNLIHLVDSIVLRSNKMRGNGKLGEYNISDRSRAMVACYPGGGTQYVKHVDNPNKDGRCITCIYYLNKDWKVQRDGGLLRIFPQGWTTEVADIDPKFDRILLFWSDRRNPHEVQPALRTRYAITLWYYDKAETEAAHRHLGQQAQQIHAANGANAVPTF